MLRRTAVFGLGTKGWVARQANDAFVAQARKDGYVSRAAYKLTDIDDRVKLLNGVDTAVIDLGSAPGSWSQVLRQRVPAGASVYGVDMHNMQMQVPGVTFIKGDFRSKSVQATLREELEFRGIAGNIDVITSDMCPNRGSGGEAMLAADLNGKALTFAVKQLRLGGHFVCKTLGSQTLFVPLVDAARRHFITVRFIKPPASRATSDESFMVCLTKRDVEAEALMEARLKAQRAKAREAGPAAEEAQRELELQSRSQLRRLSATRRRVVFAEQPDRPTRANQFGLDDFPGALRRPNTRRRGL